ncbi:MAG: dihydrodipicolinate synthase family protein [Treponema sp.]|jgi:N-acetylneuraminate lyase|nr:dihydrodipicolinate synthase family protein [Treponema sp.]
MDGIYPASITPFNGEGQFQAEVLLRLMERNIAEGASGFFIGGSSGECFLLGEAERIAVFEAAATFRGRTTLIAHIGAVSTAEAIRYALAATRLGFQHIAATPPFYYGFSAELIAGYYYDIAAAAGMPVMIYNFPGNTNKPFNLEHPATVELLRSQAIFGIKHTNLDLSQMERIKALSPGLSIMNGYDETMVAGLALGADGSIGSTFNFMLPHFKKIYDRYRAGKGREALALQVKANNIMAALNRVGLIPAIKYILEGQGIAAGPARKPFVALSADQRSYLDGVLRTNLCNAEDGK